MFLFLRQSASYPSCVSCLLHAPRCVHSKTDLFWETIEQKISVGLCISLSTDIEDSCLQLVLLFKAWAWTVAVPLALALLLSVCEQISQVS